ncbi:hypothetical protein H4582DRAFT_2001444 [Lactarius indigo]|nr:hypothetical protein H4582DRAFT_2001444 [Lactarius indigo]
MEQLSGGEKTVAALALLFATHRCAWRSSSVFNYGPPIAGADFMPCQSLAQPSSSYSTRSTRRSRVQTSDTLQFIVISLSKGLAVRVRVWELPGWGPSGPGSEQLSHTPYPWTSRNIDE